MHNAKASLSVILPLFLAAGCVGGASSPPGMTTAGTPSTTTTTPTDTSSFVALHVSVPSSLVTGQTAAISATATDDAGKETDVSALVSWTSTNLLSVSADDNTIYGIGAGKVTLTATLGTISSSADVEVVAVALQTLTLSASAETARAGVLTTWHVTGRYNDGSTADVTSSAAWSTSDPRIALIQQPGQVYAVSDGMAMVSASLAGQVVSAPLMVSEPMLVSLRIDAPAMTMSSANSEQLVATGVYSDGSTTDLTTNVGWYTSDGSLATVWQGAVQGLSSGVVTITAATGDLRGTIDLTLTE